MGAGYGAVVGNVPGRKIGGDELIWCWNGVVLREVEGSGALERVVTSKSLGTRSRSKYDG